MPLIPRIRLLAALTSGLALAAPASASATPDSATSASPASAKAAAPDRCDVAVPGAAHEVGACLPDLTTAGTVANGHSDPAQWAGLQPAGATLPFWVVDVFTDSAFAGNPLAVVGGGEELSTRQCQALARQFNLSETTFPIGSDAAGADYRLRIFTPASSPGWAALPPW